MGTGRNLPSRKARRLGLSLIVLAVLVGPGLCHLVCLSWWRHTLQRKQHALETAHQELARERERLTSDSTYVEGLIRATFKLAKPGELVVPLDSDNPRSTQKFPR